MNDIVREIKKEEYALLAEFLYEAIYIPKGHEPPPKSIINNKELQEYIFEFGKRAHDACLVAEIDGLVVGAIWARIMNDYGHINEKTPSLAMSVLKNHRGKGIGTLLLKRFILLEKEAGYVNMSLSVQKDNYALKIYQQAGFRIINETSQEYIMVIDL